MQIKYSRISSADFKGGMTDLRRKVMLYEGRPHLSNSISVPWLKPSLMALIKWRTTVFYLK